MKQLEQIGSSDIGKHIFANVISDRVYITDHLEKNGHNLIVR